MRRQRIDLRNARHRCNERRADRAARADEISLALRKMHELFGNDVKHGKAVFDYRPELAFKA